MSTRLRVAPTPRKSGRSIDESRWPLVVVTFDGDATDDEYRAYMNERTAQLARREKHATILDGRTCGAMPPSQRKMQADWQREHAELVRQYTLGLAFLIQSPVLRGVLTAVLWMQPLSAPHHVAGTWPEAERWTIERLRAAGLSVPSAGG